MGSGGCRWRAGNLGMVWNHEPGRAAELAAGEKRGSDLSEVTAPGKIVRMSDTNQSATGTAGTLASCAAATPGAPVVSAPAATPVIPRPVLDADKVYFALAHPGRRRLLESLAQQRSCTAAQAGSGGGRLKRDSTSKQLQELVKAGLATMPRDEKDSRRRRYTLHPGLTAVKNAQGQWEMDLGCCVMRWG